MYKFVTVFLGLLAFSSALTPSSFLSASDKKRLTDLFNSNLSGNDLSLSYAVLGLKVLGSNPGNAADLCKKIQASLDSDKVSAEALMAATSAAKSLGSCPLKLNAQASQILKSQASVADLHHGVLSQLNLGQKVDSAAVLKALTEALKKDDSIGSLGLAFNLAAHLGKTEGAAVFDRIEDAIVQADEINGKFLQFEGGLSVSSQVISGAYALAQTLGKAPPISKLQSVKLANYFISR